MICTALVLGQVLFGGVVVFLVHIGNGPLATTPLPALEWIAVGAAVLALPTAVLVRRLVSNQVASAELAFQQGLIVFMAMLEGAGLLNLVVWMLNGSTLPNGVTAAVLVILQRANFPRREQLPGA
jgi:hypothetical protein